MFFPHPSNSTTINCTYFSVVARGDKHAIRVRVHTNVLTSLNDHEYIFRKQTKKGQRGRHNGWTEGKNKGEIKNIIHLKSFSNHQAMEML
jgi:hypothetical protein